MKKTIALLLSLMLIVSLSACNKKPNDDTTTTTTGTVTTTTVETTTTTTAPSGDTSSTASSAETTQSTASDAAATTSSGATTTSVTGDNTIATSQTGSTTAKPVDVANTAWNLLFEDNYGNVHHYIMDFKTKKLRYDTCMLWSELFTAENWVKTKKENPDSVLTFNNKEYYADISVTYDFTYSVEGEEITLNYRLGNTVTVDQKLVMENNTLKVVSDTNSFGSIQGKVYKRK